MSVFSPYDGIPEDKWVERTKRLIRQHPLDMKEVVDICLGSWNSIFDSKIGLKGFNIGKDIVPKPQIMGFFLHELIALELSSRYPEEWRGEDTSDDKDLVCIANSKYSVEIKTSSHPSKIFGNRSYAQKANKNKKEKSGYYLAINFQKFTKRIKEPKILKIRFGWLDHDDWLAQKAASGQQAHLSPAVESKKLLTFYSLE
jgi:hypothetical protein